MQILLIKEGPKEIHVTDLEIHESKRIVINVIVMQLNPENYTKLINLSYTSRLYQSPV